MNNTLQGRPLATLTESFIIMTHAFRALPRLKHALSSSTLSKQQEERIMLAVTQVNGCALCSYAHTRMALEAGLSTQEIENMLQGQIEAPEEDLPALMFAQHYADTRGHPTEKSLKRLKELYGSSQAKAIISAIQVIMFGNAYGIPMGSLLGRIKHEKKHIDNRSSLLYELLMLILLIPYIPIAFIVAIVFEILRKPILS